MLEEKLTGHKFEMNGIKFEFKEVSGFKGDVFSLTRVY